MWFKILIQILGFSLSYNPNDHGWTESSLLYNNITCMVLGLPTIPNSPVTTGPDTVHLLGSIADSVKGLPGISDLLHRMCSFILPGFLGIYETRYTWDDTSSISKFILVEASISGATSSWPPPALLQSTVNTLVRPTNAFFMPSPVACTYRDNYDSNSNYNIVRSK